MTKYYAVGGVERCPHCSVATPLFAIMWAGRTASTAGNGDSWALGACVRCGKCICVGSYPGENLDLAYPYYVSPRPVRAHEDIPEPARAFLQQAFDTLHAPDAASVMAGSAVDAMLKQLGYADGSVYTRIDKALEDNIITLGMSEWAHAVRLGSNRPRHADLEKPHTNFEEASNSVAFAEALGNFLFVLSARVKRGVEEANAPHS